LTLQNFKSFPPRVIYIDVLPNPQLTELQQALRKEVKKDLKLFNANYKDRPFVPHVTVAFRDLRKSAYYSAWETFGSKEFHYQFLATELSLLKHDGKVWRVMNRFPFGPH